MKNSIYSGMAALLAAVVILAGCENPNDITETTDKTVLGNVISAANTAKEGVIASIDGTDIDSAVYWVTTAQLADFTAAITAAREVYDSVGADQTAVDNAKTALETATAVFNGQKQLGTQGTEAGYDVYMAGQTSTGPYNSMVKVWKNNSLLYTLTDGSNGGQAQDIVVVGSDVYVLTMEVKEVGSTAVKVWKNGILLYVIHNGTDWVFGDSLFVNGTDVYAGGSKENNIAKVWKNGSALYSLTPDNGLMGNVFSMAVVGNDVYSAGYEENISNNWVAKVWKNAGVLYTLTDGTNSAVARVVDVVDNDIYVLEDESADVSKIRVWKNNSLLYTLVEEVVSPPAMIMALDMVVVDGNVYSLGIDGTDSKIWKNNMVLYSSSSAGAGFSCFTVVPRP